MEVLHRDSGHERADLEDLIWPAQPLRRWFRCRRFCVSTGQLKNLPFTDRAAENEWG